MKMEKDWSFIIGAIVVLLLTFIVAARPRRYLTARRHKFLSPHHLLHFLPARLKYRSLLSDKSRGILGLSN